MRTNIVLDDELVREAMRVTGETTKTALVHRGLRELIRLDRLARLRRLRGRLKWNGDLGSMRERTRRG